MKIIFALLIAAPLAAQTGSPVGSVFGNLNCGVRAYGTAQVQTWCWHGPAPWVLVHNTIQILNAGSSITLSFVDTPDQITWIVKGPAPYSYQIATSAAGGSLAGTLPVPGAATSAILTAARASGPKPPSPPPAKRSWIGKILHQH